MGSRDWKAWGWSVLLCSSYCSDFLDVLHIGDIARRLRGRIVTIACDCDVCDANKPPKFSMNLPLELRTAWEVPWDLRLPSWGETGL